MSNSILAGIEIQYHRVSRSAGPRPGTVIILEVAVTSSRWRSIGVVPLAIAGTAALALPTAVTPVSASGPRTVAMEPALLSSDGDEPFVNMPPAPGQGVALLIGGSGDPIPDEADINTAFDNYVIPNGYGSYDPTALFTPEGLNIIEGQLNVLPFDKSVAEGVTILNGAIKENLQEGHPVFVGGISQSSTVVSDELRDIQNGSLGFQPSPDQLAFGLLGNPSNPNGGLLERFDLPQDPNVTIPSLGITFNGAAPADTGYPTVVYSLEYDGDADFPRYTGDFLSDLNAVLGIDFVHPDYIATHVAPGQGITPAEIADAVKLPTSAGYDGDTTYYEIPDPHQLPLGIIIQDIFGKPVADLLDPDLRVLVNLGYGTNPDIGWSTAPANEPTPLALFPSLDSEQLNTIVQALEAGATKGFDDFMADLSHPSDSASADGSGGGLAALMSLFSSSAAADPTSVTTVGDGLNGAVSTLNGIVNAISDDINALQTVLPAADATVFSTFLQEGDLTDAINVPIAANTGLEALALGISLAVLGSNLPTLFSDLGDAF
jgi:hypothetical protein